MLKYLIEYSLIDNYKMTPVFTVQPIIIFIAADKVGHDPRSSPYSMLSSSVTTFFRSFAVFCKQSQHYCGWNGYIYKLLDVCEAYYSIVCNFNGCHFTLRLQELSDHIIKIWILTSSNTYRERTGSVFHFIWVWAAGDLGYPSLPQKAY